MDVAIVGGGICGLSLALNLKERGIACRVYERAPEIKPLGVGITLLPHAMREFSTLGLGDELLEAGIENQDCRFFNRFGQLIYREERGKFAGYPFPEVGIHRGRLHVILYEAVQKRLGQDAVLTDCECVGLDQDDSGATVHFKQTSTGTPRESVRSDLVDSLRRHQFGTTQAIPPERQDRVFRNQYLARSDATQADLGRPHLHAGRLDSHR